MRLSDEQIKKLQENFEDNIKDFGENNVVASSGLIKNFLDTIEALQQENEQLQEFANAKAEGRLMVLPCKVGDIVYANCYGEVIGWEIHQIEMSLGEPTQYIACGDDEGYGAAEIDFTGEDIGKTVFLTREEAEKALQEGLK